MKPVIFKYLLGGLVAATAAGASAQANHLVMSEILMNSDTENVNDSAEYVEIFNPTAAPINLENYYITDSNLYTSASLLTNGSINVGDSDNIVKFPAGTVLNSGQVAVVAYAGSAFLTDFFSGQLSGFTSLQGSPLLFEVTESDAAIANMTVLNSYSGTTGSPTNFSRTNGGEFLIMFYWDGTSDLVKDVDIAAWGTATGANLFDPKDATNTGKNGTPYLVDNGSVANLAINPAPALMKRVSTTEASEVATGGNGLTGHDETTENVPTSWAGEAIGGATPGLTSLTAVGENMVPSIGDPFRNIQFPSSSQSVTVSASVTDADGAVASVKLYVNSGSGFSAVTATNTGGSTWSATIGPFADDTVVKYYLEATDNQGGVRTLPTFAPTDFNVFVVDNTPVQPGDVVINEILYDNIGADSYEYVELVNTRNTPIKLPYFRFADRNFSWFVFPENAEIPANGYMVLSLDPAAMELNYTPVPGVQYYDWGTFVINNGDEDIYLAHPNGYQYNGATSYVDHVSYTSTAPWPEINGNSTGKSIELKNPMLDNNLGANWAGTDAIGTPGAVNSQFSAAPGVANVTRSAEFPAPSTPITITAEVTPVAPTTIAAARVFVNTGSGFAPVAMTAGSGNTYSAQIGGYPEGTIVKYYVEAENNSGLKTTVPANAPTDILLFHVNANPVTDQDLVVNEILYNNPGPDTYEYIELYNTRSTPLNLSYFRLGDATAAFYTFPEGSTIPGNGYLVLTMDEATFSMNYTVPGGVQVLDWGTFALNNGGDLVYIAHPNSINFNGTTTNMEEINYDDVAPWPVTDSDNTGKSIELKNPALDNSVGANWGPSIAIGTPGAANTTTSNVNNWTLY